MELGYVGSTVRDMMPNYETKVINHGMHADKSHLVCSVYGLDMLSRCVREGDNFLTFYFSF